MEQEWSNKWLVFIVVCVQYMTQIGLCFSLGALFLDFQQAFGASRLQTALVQSLLIGVVLSMSVFSGCCIRRYGLFKVILCPALLSPLGFMTSYAATDIWNIYITIGFIAGLGMTCTQTASFVVVRQAFRGKQMMLCLSILSTGAGVGGMFYPFLLSFLVQRLGLQMTLLSIGVFFMTSSLLPLLIRCHDIKDADSRKSDDPENGPYTISKDTSGEESNGNDKIIEETTLVAIWEDFKSIISLKYIIVVVSSDLIVASINGSITALQLDLMKSKNVDTSWSNMVFIVRSVSVIVSSLLPGIGKQFGISVNVMLSVASMIGAAGYLLLQLTSGHLSFLFANGMVGATLGALLPASMIAMKMVRTELMPVASGLMTSGIGVLTAAAGPLFAFIRESTGSYDLVLYLIAAIHCAGALAFLAGLLVKNREIENRGDFVITRL